MNTNEIKTALAAAGVTFTEDATGIHIEKPKVVKTKKATATPVPLTTSADDLELLSNLKARHIGHTVNPKTGAITITSDYSYGGSKLSSLGSLVEVQGDLDLSKAKRLRSLGALKVVAEDLNLENQAGLTTLGSLKSVGNNLNLDGTTALQDLGALTKIGGGLYVSNSGLRTLGPKLTMVGNNVHLDKVVSLGSLTKVGEDLNAGIDLEDIGALTEVGDRADLGGCEKLKSLGGLRRCQTLVITGSAVESLGRLETCSEVAAENAPLRDLGDWRALHPKNRFDEGDAVLEMTDRAFRLGSGGLDAIQHEFSVIRELYEDKDAASVALLKFKNKSNLHNLIARARLEGRL